MLKYTVKANKESILSSFPIRSFYVSPDLSYISGTTDYETGLVNGEDVLIRSPYLIGDELNTINVENVIVQGKVQVSIVLPVKTIRKKIKFHVESDYYNGQQRCFYVLRGNDVYINCNSVSGDSVFKTVEQKYVEYNGDISYFFSGDTKGYLVDHKFYSATTNTKYITIDAEIPIENGKLTVGNYVYDVEFIGNNSLPVIKLNKTKEQVYGGNVLGTYDGKKTYLIDSKSIYTVTAKSLPLATGQVYITDYIKSKWKRVRKFSIAKHENPKLLPEIIMYGGYKHFVKYQEKNYYLKDVYNGDNYLGYGILIDDKFYPEIPGYIDIDIYEAHKDLCCTSNTIYIDELDESLEVQDSLVSYTNGGKFIIFVDTTENNDIVEGNYIIAESNGPIKIVRDVVGFDDNSDGLYITYKGNRYDVKGHLCDTVIINGNKYQLTYLNDNYTSASTIINGNTLYFDVNGAASDNTVARLSNKIYYSASTSTVNSTIIKYGLNESWYKVEKNSGVTINDVIYPLQKNEIVLPPTEEGGEETVVEVYTVEFYDMVQQTFEVHDIEGSSSYLCYPVIDGDLLSEYDEDTMQREMCSLVVEDWKNFTFRLRKDTFGNKPFTPENGLVESLQTTKPYTTSDSFLLQDKIEIYRVQDYLSFNFPVVNKSANNLRREDTINGNFVNDIKNDSVNKIVDMEKDIYFPTYIVNSDESIKNYLSATTITDTIRKKYINKYINTYTDFYPTKKLRFNLHFRTRNLDNWKIIEDDREFSGQTTTNSEMSNWFITDYKYYKDNLQYFDKKLQNSSDLLGFLNFTTNDVKNNATKISKSFLRLSFYSTNNPKTQILLATSTVFFDENHAFKKFMDAQRGSDLIYKNVDYTQKGNAQTTGKTISVLTEVLDDIYLNDTLRLSSRFEIEDKYNTKTSAEGYYIYMFKEYAKKMHEGVIYLKVEFNHAGIGKTITFTLPRGEDGKPLYVHKSEDLKKLKNGFTTKDIYYQTYIPINIVYDNNSKKYVYYFPDDLLENDELSVDKGIMEFNLFETKFANESLVKNIK